MIIKGFTQARHIAMAENAEATTAQTGLFAVNFDVLRSQIANDGLRRCQGYRALRHIQTSLPLSKSVRLENYTY